MDKTASQTLAAPNNGASNANDFQPTTRNPQTAQTNLFQQQNAIQNVTNTQELLGDNQNAKISITTNPASSPPEVARVSETPIVFITAVGLALLVIGFIVFRKLRNDNIVPENNIAALETVETAPIIAEETVTKPTPKKKTKKSKRKHR